MARGLKAIVVPGIARLVRRFGRRFDRFMSFLIQSDGGTGRPTLWNRADWIRNKGEGGGIRGSFPLLLIIINHRSQLLGG